MMIERARKGGIEIVDLLGSSAYYAPAAGVVKMAEAITTDSRGVIPCCAYCQKEYNVGGYFVGVPAVLGKNGVEKIEQGITSPEELLRVVMVEDILGLRQSISENEKEPV